MQPKSSTVLKSNNYYVVSGKDREDGPLEHIMVYFEGIELKITHPSEAHNPKETYVFKVVALLSECDEGAPEVGETISCLVEDMEEMAERGIVFREPTSTEMILYGSTRNT